MAILTKAKLAKLEKRLKAKLGSQNSFKETPTAWEQFVGLTTIRSGGEMKRFKVYPYQRLLVELSQQYPNMIILKSRQMGITQCIVSKFLHDACINPAASSILFMRNGEDASAISRRARQMLNSIPEYALPDSDNVGYLKIRNGGDLYFKNSGREGSRSLDSATGMLFDEAAFVENIQQIYAASSPSSALSGDKIQKFIVSTPSAKSGWYWDKLNENNDCDIEQLAKDVSEGKLYKDIPGVYWFIDSAGTCKLILHWLAHPVYKEIPNYLEYRLQQDGTDWETIQREYNLRFVDSAVAVFDSALIRKNAIGKYENTRDEETSYYCGLDCSTIGSDYTVFTVFKWSEGKLSLVHLYRKRQQTSEYHLYHIGELINRYKPKCIGVEITGGVGQLYLEQLQKQYPQFEFQAIRTTSESKTAMISSMVLALEREQLIYPENCPLIDEMLSFRRVDKKLEAAQGKHDDCVMSTAFGVIVSPLNQERKSVFSDVLKNIKG